MGCLIVTIIAGTLCVLDIISVNAYLFALFGSLAWMYVAAGLYFACGFLSFFYHDFLHWHRPDDSPEWSDGYSMHCVCRYCGKEIMQDSQGNWFTFEEV